MHLRHLWVLTTAPLSSIEAQRSFSSGENPLSDVSAGAGLRDTLHGVLFRSSLGQQQLAFVDNNQLGTKLGDLALPPCWRSRSVKDKSEMSFEVFTFILAILISIVLIFLAIWNVSTCESM